MKKYFNWYLKPTPEEIESIWKNGILTVDTNVLLDLYRYHESTRESLILSLKKFEGKKWLSHQVSQEFIKNRTKVIVSSNQTFKQAQEELDKLRKSLESAVSQLKGNRIIPRDTPDKLHEATSSAIDEATSKIKQAKESYPKYFQHDPVLLQLSAIFNDSVGEPFSAEELEALRKIAEERKQNQVPPGYLDDEKDDDRPYGDYFLWHQILEQAKKEQSPVILVTSERKDDWWERISGITTGPRPELLKEAMEYSGQRIIIYKTEIFLEQALKRLQQPVNSVAIEEIRAVSARRSELATAVHLKQHITSESTEYRNTGKITIDLLRPVRNFTASGRLDPNMDSTPNLTTTLLQAPDNLPPRKLRASTGTTYDFNIHITSENPDISLPPGEYVFSYEATCEEPTQQPEMATPPN